MSRDADSDALRMPRGRKTKRGAIIAGAIFIGIWTLVVGGFDAMTVFNTVSAWRSGSYPTTPGVVTSSGTQSQMTSGGSGGRARAGRSGSRTYKAMVTYDYTVNGALFTGSRIRYGQWSTSRASHAQVLASQYPVGGAVSVHYNPTNPGVSVLEAGIRGGDRFMLIFLLPFNLLLAAIWIYAIYSLRGGVAAFPRVIEDVVTRVRMNVLPPALVGVIGGLAVSVPCLFGFAFLRGAEATANELAIVMGLTVGGFALAWAWFWMRVRSGTYDLVIDRTRKAVTLPRVRVKPGENADVAFANVREIGLRKSETEQVNRRAVNDVVVVYDDAGAERIVKLRGWGSKATANEFARWLRRRVGQ